MSQSFIVRLRGGTHANLDGTNRQHYIAECRRGDGLALQAQPDNPHDRHAVAVFDSRGRQLGYLPSDARDASSILRGEGVSAVVEKRIGGTRWWHRLLGMERHFGFLIRLTKAPIDWAAHNAHRERAERVDSIVSEVLSFERSGGEPNQAITRYAAALAAVITLNRDDPIAAAHRYQAAPIAGGARLDFRGLRPP